MIAADDIPIVVVVALAIVVWIAYRRFAPPANRAEGQRLKLPSPEPVTRESQKHPQQVKPPQPSPPAACSMHFSGILSPPMLPSTLWIAEPERTLSSMTTAGVNYSVSLALRTCTCEDFGKRRSTLDANDVRRFCKHALKVIGDEDMWEELPPICEAVLIDDYFTSADYVHADTVRGSPVAFAWSSHRPWINVFVPDDLNHARKRLPVADDYIRSAYSLKEQRWTYDDKPPAPNILRAVIIEKFRWSP